MARTAAQEFKDIVTAYRDDIEARNKAIIDAGIGIYRHVHPDQIVDDLKEVLGDRFDEHVVSFTVSMALLAMAKGYTIVKF